MTYTIEIVDNLFKTKSYLVPSRSFLSTKKYIEYIALPFPYYYATKIIARLALMRCKKSRLWTITSWERQISIERKE